MVLALACGDDDDSVTTADFTVRIENIGPANTALSTGVFNTPVGASEPGALTENGDEYSFTITAPPGARLNFATMFVPSNDYFIAPPANGIELFLEPTGQPLNGDITNQLDIWDAGTEADQPLGDGDTQANPGNSPGQAANDIGPADPNNQVRPAVAANLPAVADIVQVTVTASQANAGVVTEFTVRIISRTDETTLTLPGGGTRNVILTPGVWVVQAPNQSDPFFTNGQPDRGLGLEALAEDGVPSTLNTTLMPNIGPTVPLSPGAFAVFSGTNPQSQVGESASPGLEDVAEDGAAAVLASEFAAAMNVMTSNSFGAGPIGPGGSVEFSFTASPGDALTFATMYIESNDAYLSPGAPGIPLFTGDTPTNGDVTAQIQLYDAGTEVNEEPGFGPNQPLRSGADVGTDEEATVRAISSVNDGFTYQSVMQTVRVTITSTSS